MSLTAGIDKQFFREKAQIDARIARVEEHNHFGDWKYIDNGLAELRWKNGRRIYFVKLKGEIIFITYRRI